MADPNLEDLAELTPPGVEAFIKEESAPLFLAKVSDAIRTVVGELGRARRRIINLEQENARLTESRRRDLETLETLANVHRLPAYGNEGRCAGCRRKWPCKTAKILGVDDE